MLVTLTFLPFLRKALILHNMPSLEIITPRIKEIMTRIIFPYLVTSINISQGQIKLILDYPSQQIYKLGDWLSDVSAKGDGLLVWGDSNLNIEKYPHDIEFIPVLTDVHIQI